MIWPWPRRRSVVVVTKVTGGGKTPPGRGRGGNGGKNGGGAGPRGPVVVGNLGGTNSASGSTLSWSHTCAAGSKQLLMVQVSFDRGAGGTPIVTGVTFAGVAMIPLVQDLDRSQNGRLSVWYLVAPAAGAQTVEVTWGGSVTNMRTESRDYSVVDQNTPLSTPVTAVGGDAAPTATINGVGSPGFVVDFLNVHGGGVSQRTFSLNCGQTQQYNVTAPTGGNGHGGGYKRATGSVQMCWTINTGAEWRLIVASVNPG